MRIVVPMGGPPPSSFAFGETARSARTRGVVNDALTIYFLDATITSAFAARWCAAQRVEAFRDARLLSGGVRPKSFVTAISESGSPPSPQVGRRCRISVT